MQNKRVSNAFLNFSYRPTYPASAWRTEGHRFESYIVHQKERPPDWVVFLCFGRWTRTHLTATVRWTVADTSSKTGVYNNFCPQGKNAIRVLYRPPYMKNLNYFTIGSAFGFFIYIKDITYWCYRPEDFIILWAFLFYPHIWSDGTFFLKWSQKQKQGGNAYA